MAQRVWAVARMISEHARKHGGRGRSGCGVARGRGYAGSQGHREAGAAAAGPASRSKYRAMNSAAAADGKAVYVRGLPPDWDDHHLTSYFGAHGEVESARMLPAKEGQRARAAFVNFASSEDARAAVLKCDQQLTEDSSGRVYWIGCSIKGGVNKKVDIVGFDTSVPNEILDGFLFIGNRDNAACEDDLRQLGITSILSILPDDEEFVLSGGLAHLRLPAVDSEDQDLCNLLDPACAFLERARCAGSRALVHCVAGRSRSPAVVLAYLMRHWNMPLSEAFALVQQRRPFCRPNEGFWRQLQMEELRLFSAASPIPVPYRHLGPAPLFEHSWDPREDFMAVQLGDGALNHAPSQLVKSLEQDLLTLSAQHTADDGVFLADKKKDKIYFVPANSDGVANQTRAAACKSTMVQILGFYGFSHAVFSSTWSTAGSRAAGASPATGRTIRV